MAARTQFDPNVLQALAERLLAKARSIVLVTTIRFGLLGTFVVAGVAFVAAKGSMGLAELVVAGALGGFVGGVMGFVVGTAKAEALRVQAHGILWQIRMEEWARDTHEAIRTSIKRAA